MSTPPWVVVVAETPSLARCIADLLESDGHRVTTVARPGRGLTHRLRQTDEPARLVISASNGFHCETAHRWMRGEGEGIDLVVVGSRDPALRSGPKIHVVRLPLAPDRFLELVRSYLAHAPSPVVRGHPVTRHRAGPVTEAHPHPVAALPAAPRAGR